MGSLQRLEIIIKGRVQGVFFRYGAKEFADNLGLTGCVRNESDGSVKIIAEGAADALQKLIDWCKKGTEFAKVNKVDVEWKFAANEYKSFDIL